MHIAGIAMSTYLMNLETKMLILIILDNTGEKIVKMGVFCIEYVLA